MLLILVCLHGYIHVYIISSLYMFICNDTFLFCPIITLIFIHIHTDARKHTSDGFQILPQTETSTGNENIKNTLFRLN